MARVGVIRDTLFYFKPTKWVVFAFHGNSRTHFAAWVDIDVKNEIFIFLQVFSGCAFCEGWGFFPRALNRLASLLLKINPNGLMFLSGDVHLAEVIKSRCIGIFFTTQHSSSFLLCSIKEMNSYYWTYMLYTR